MQLSEALLAKIAEIPERGPDDDQIVALIVAQRPDPAGEDADITTTLAGIGQAHVNGLCTLQGVVPDRIYIVSELSNVEVGEPSIQTGADVLAAP